ncbi:MAG: hypothetical protein FJ291_21465 [Planctomycetes bacterium]|nr:hypothetical protein [Planctomycetota bacterium]
MPLQLTLEEHDTAQRLIANLGASVKWKWYRWVGVSLALLPFAVSVYCFSFLVESERMLAREPIGLIPGGHGDVMAESLRQYVDFRARLALCQMSLLFCATVNALVGIQVLVGVLVNWRRHLRDSLLAKLLRAALEREGAELVDEAGHRPDGA